MSHDPHHSGWTRDRTTPPPGSGDPRPTGTLLSDAVSQMTRLVRGEIQLAKAEVKENVRNAGMGVGFMLVAVVIAFVALNVLVGALVAAIAEMGLGPGWAALIVGVALLAVAALLVMRGSAALKAENLMPSRAIRSVQATSQTIQETVTNDR